MAATKPRLTSVRICCELIAQRGSANVYDLAALCTLSESCIRYSLARGVELGYLVEGKKQQGESGNHRKTYRRTKKAFPARAVDDDDEPRAVVDWAVFTPRRDWAVVALFGPYEARA